MLAKTKIVFSFEDWREVANSILTRYQYCKYISVEKDYKL
jgi:hypothetical protein